MTDKNFGISTGKWEIRKKGKVTITEGPEGTIASQGQPDLFEKLFNSKAEAEKQAEKLGEGYCVFEVREPINIRRQ